MIGSYTNWQTKNMVEFVLNDPDTRAMAAEYFRTRERGTYAGLVMALGLEETPDGVSTFSYDIRRTEVMSALVNALR